MYEYMRAIFNTDDPYITYPTNGLISLFNLPQRINLQVIQEVLRNFAKPMGGKLCNSEEAQNYIVKRVGR